jgi:hypothetical protein
MEEIQVLFSELHPEFVGPPRQSVKVILCGAESGLLTLRSIALAEGSRDEDVVTLVVCTSEPAPKQVFLTSEDTGSIVRLIAGMFQPVAITMPAVVENIPRPFEKKGPLISRSASVLRRYNASKRKKSGKWR